MADEPPPEFVAFVVSRLDGLRAQTRRLAGDDPEVGHVYLDVLADLAGHWRLLCWLTRLTGRDTASGYLSHRLDVRTKRWREDQPYGVPVRVVQRPVHRPARTSASLALRKAALLPDTVRSGGSAVADAGIAWAQATRRQQWHRVERLIAFGILLIGTMIHLMSNISTDH